MRIEQIKTSPDRAGRYWVTFDNGEKLALYRQTVEDFGLYTGRDLSEEEYTSLQEAAGVMSAKMRAVRIVAASSVTKKDLQQRLVQKGERVEDAQTAVEWMGELSLLDDRKTAEALVSRCISKGYGLSRAKQMLYEKRIPKDIWDEVLQDYPVQTEAIEAFLQSRITAQSGEKELRRAIDALLRRGHTYAQIRKVLDRLEFSTEVFPED